MKKQLRQLLILLPTVALITACTELTERVNVYDQSGTAWNPITTTDTVTTVKIDTTEIKYTIVNTAEDTVTTWKRMKITTVTTHFFDTTRATPGALTQKTNQRTVATRDTIFLLDTVITLKYIAPIAFSFDSSSVNAPTTTVKLNVNTGISTLVFLHFGITNAKIASAALVTPDASIELLVDSSSVELLAFPGSKGISGSGGVLTLNLVGLTAGNSVYLTDLSAANENQRTLATVAPASISVK